MIISMLNGGLGNQFFQYATGKLIAQKNNVEFKIDPSYLNAFRFYRAWNRKPEILRFNLKHKVALSKEVHKYRFSTGISYLDMYLMRVGIFNKKIYSFHNNDKDKMLKKKETYLLSFFSGDFFESIKKELKEELTLRDISRIKDKIKEIKECDSVSIHVRRGDLLQIKGSYILSMGYYKDAIQRLGSKNKLKFYVFSDDIDWCKENFGWLENKEFVSGNSVSEDFELMKHCKYNILANSTLSWWVGYLGEARKVVAPRHFGYSINNPQEEMLFRGWVVI